MAWHKGSWWPLYVAEWYMPRVSQHLFDPYSFMHIMHGFVFYVLLVLMPEMTMGFRSAWWWIWIVGAVLNFLFELGVEALENTETIIRRFRQNSGTSHLYRGDSYQNILGDCLSCLFGWYVMAICVHHNMFSCVIIWVIVTEVGLLLYMRDTGILVVIQLLFGFNSIREWQAAAVPKKASEWGRKEMRNSSLTPF